MSDLLSMERLTKIKKELAETLPEHHYVLVIVPKRKRQQGAYLSSIPTVVGIKYAVSYTIECIENNRVNEPLSDN